MKRKLLNMAKILWFCAVFMLWVTLAAMSPIKETWPTADDDILAPVPPPQQTPQPPSEAKIQTRSVEPEEASSRQLEAQEQPVNKTEETQRPTSTTQPPRARDPVSPPVQTTDKRVVNIQPGLPYYRRYPNYYSRGFPYMFYPFVFPYFGGYYGGYGGFGGYGGYDETYIGDGYGYGGDYGGGYDYGGIGGDYGDFGGFSDFGGFGDY